LMVRWRESFILSLDVHSGLVMKSDLKKVLFIHLNKRREEIVHDYWYEKERTCVPANGTEGV